MIGLVLSSTASAFFSPMRSVSGHDVSEITCSGLIFLDHVRLVRELKLPCDRSQTMNHRQIIRTLFMTSAEKNTCTYWMIYAVASFDSVVDSTISDFVYV